MDLARTKVGPAQNVERRQALAWGVGELVLRQTWQHITYDARRLSRMGVSVRDGEAAYPWKLSINDVSPLCRLTSLVFCLMEERVWSYSHSSIYPAKFCKLLRRDGEFQESAWDEARQDWDAILFIEKARHRSIVLGDMWTEMSWWAASQSVQLLFRLLAKANFKPCESIEFMIRTLVNSGEGSRCTTAGLSQSTADGGRSLIYFSGSGSAHVGTFTPPRLASNRKLKHGIGDTKLIEDSHNDVRDMFRSHKAPIFKSMAIYNRLQDNVALNKRHLPTISIGKSEFDTQVPATTQ